MRASRSRALFLTVLMGGALAWALLRAGPSSTAQRVPESSKARCPPVFTTAHPSALEAIRDFLNRRPAPVQPIAFTHKAHLAAGMQCTHCHAGVDQGPEAAIPGVSLCMACHQVIARDRPEIKKLAAYLGRGEDVPWARVYDYSPSGHVKFNHAVHVRAKVSCASCHGDMTQQTTAQRVVNLTMGSCIECHKRQAASIECVACHF